MNNEDLKKTSETLHKVSDKIIYIGACICTLGVTWLVRVVITEAIRVAMKDEIVVTTRLHKKV